jgi:tetratricopeptide (TPR) repeat protein
MKKLPIYLFFLTLSMTAFSQEIYHSVAEEVCDCLKKELNNNLDFEDIENICITPALERNQTALKKELGDEFVYGEQFGIEIARILVVDCPEFVNYAIEQTTSNSKKAEEYHRKAEKARESRNYEAALDFFDQAIALDPVNDTFFNSRGTVYFSVDDYYKAIADFIRAMEINDQNYLYYYNTAHSLYQLNDPGESLYYLERALSLKDDHCNSYNLKGVIYEDENISDSSKVYFKKAYDCSPDDPQMSYNLAFAYYNNQEYKDALKWFEVSDSLGYDGAGIYSYMGNCYFAFEEYANAIGYHEKHFRLDSLNYIPLYNIGTCYYNLAEYDQAIDALKKSYDLEKEDSDIPYYISKAYFQKKDIRTAHAYIDQALDLNPSSPELFDKRAEIFTALKEYEKAIADYNVSLSLYPDDCRIYQELGKIYKITGQIDEADRSFAKSVELGCDQ